MNPICKLPFFMYFGWTVKVFSLRFPSFLCFQCEQGIKIPLLLHQLSKGSAFL